MKKIKIVLLLLAAVLLLAACSRGAEETAAERSQSALSEQTENSEQTAAAMHSETGEGQMLVDINGQVFQAELYDNETTAALGERLPMTITMEAMNGNEKFYFLDESLPTNTETVGTIQKGDIMLYGSNCLVVFYKTFDTGYSYTRLGHIADTEALEAALGDGNVTISFRRAE